MEIESAVCTHVGRRSNNEDNACAEPSLGLFAVADGVGGYEGGEVASEIVVQTVPEFVRRNLADDEVTWPFKLDRKQSFDENLLRVALLLANQRIVARKKGSLSGMGSTVAAVRLCGERAVFAHVGDSRVYRLREGELSQLTVDHSLYNEMKQSGAADLPPRHLWNYSNVITRALGLSSSQPELRSESLRDQDLFLLCTDGLYESVRDEEIAEVLRAHAVEPACQELVRRAFEHGGKDNITVVLARVSLYTRR